MSLIIFFGMALVVFICGLLAVGITLYRWRVEAYEKKVAEAKPSTVQ